MIFTTQTNSNEMTLGGMAIKTNSINIRVPGDDYSPDFCYCLYECDEVIPVWGGGSGWQNDKTTFLFKKLIATDTALLKIYKNGSLVATINDNSYGVWNPSYSSDTLQYSFIADWDLIFTAFGYGTYNITNEYTLLSVANTFTSVDYQLSVFTDAQADKWVKFNWTQTGVIENSPFTFDEGIDFSYKLRGDFERINPETISDNYKTSSREINQFRTEQKNKYLMTSRLLNQSDYLTINNNLALANRIEVVDFNIFGTNLREKDLSFVELSNYDKHKLSRRITINIQFEDYEQDIIKTNC